MAVKSSAPSQIPRFQLVAGMHGNSPALTVLSTVLDCHRDHIW